MQTFSFFRTLTRRSTFWLSEDSSSLRSNVSREASTTLSKAFYLIPHPQRYRKGCREVLLDNIEKKRLAHLDRSEITFAHQRLLGRMDTATLKLLLKPLESAHAVLQAEDVLRRHTTSRNVRHGSINGCRVIDRNDSYG